MFIQIKEAYEVLSDPVKRTTHKQRILSRTTNTSNNNKDARERIYQEWVRHQHREELKRKVAEMRRKEKEEVKNFSWYYFGFFQLIGYIIMGAVLVLLTVLPIVVFFSEDNKMDFENKYTLWIPATMGASFIGYVIYHNFFLRKKSR